MIDLAEQVFAAIGDDPLDVLVNNAGGGGFSPTEDTTPDMFDLAFNLNVKAPYILTGAFAPAMAKRGHGAIVNVAASAPRWQPRVPAPSRPRRRP